MGGKYDPDAIQSYRAGKHDPHKKLQPSISQEEIDKQFKDAMQTQRAYRDKWGRNDMEINKK